MSKEHTHSAAYCCCVTCAFCPCLCKEFLSSAGPPTKDFFEPLTDAKRNQTGALGTDTWIPATDSRLLFVGRSRIVSERREFDFPCSTVRFIVTGPCKEIWLEFGARIGDHNRMLPQFKQNAIPNSAGLMKSYVNGVAVRKVAISEQPAQYLMATDLGEGEHEITVSKCSEFWFGVILFSGVVLPQGVSLKASAPKRVIEIIGDSNSTGPGCVGPNSYNDGEMKKQMMRYTDCDLTWPSNLKPAFDADIYLMGCSGLGFMANAMGPAELPHGPMIDIYTRVCENEPEEMAELPHADISIILLGPNDWVGGGMAGKDEQAIAGYKKLIDLVRSKRPTTPILCLYPDNCSLGGAPNLALWSRTMQNGFHVNVSKWVKGAVEQAGGEKAKVYAREVVPKEKISGGGDEDFGMMGHWNVEGGRKFCTGVTPLVANIMGWSASTLSRTKTSAPTAATI